MSSFGTARTLSKGGGGFLGGGAGRKNVRVTRQTVIARKVVFLGNRYGVYNYCKCTPQFFLRPKKLAALTIARSYLYFNLIYIVPYQIYHIAFLCFAIQPYNYSIHNIMRESENICSDRIPLLGPDNVRRNFILYGKSSFPAWLQKESNVTPPKSNKPIRTRNKNT